MNEQAPAFARSPIIVGTIPGQNPAVWARAVELAEALAAPLVAAYVDPASYLIEWKAGNEVAPTSLDPVLEPDDEAALAAAGIRDAFGPAASGHGVAWSLRVIGGDPALALGRLATAVGASSIVIGTRRLGLLAKVNELATGSLMHRLLATQHLPVLGIPSHEAHHRLRAHE
ncbi:universal stress protein [Arthrobacter sp.]|uniref:universal stress protein n=1 Tax=Arthrobacter sp. TaxID=1667 RepID=UPI003A901DC8